MAVTKERIDCPNCRTRTRKFIALGNFRFCNMTCAYEYVSRMRKWIENQIIDLDCLTQKIDELEANNDIRR